MQCILFSPLCLETFFLLLQVEPGLNIFSPEPHGAGFQGCKLLEKWKKMHSTVSVGKDKIRLNNETNFFVIAWLSGWAPVCCLFFLRFVSSRAGSLIFSLSSYLSMHCVLIMPPAWVLVWSSDAGKSLPCRTFPLVQPLDCPSLVAGLSPCAGIRPWCAQAGPRQGNISVSAQLLLLF